MLPAATSSIKTDPSGRRAPLADVTNDDERTRRLDERADRLDRMVETLLQHVVSSSQTGQDRQDTAETACRVICSTGSHRKQSGGKTPGDVHGAMSPVSRRCLKRRDGTTKGLLHKLEQEKRLLAVRARRLERRERQLAERSRALELREFAVARSDSLAFASEIHQPCALGTADPVRVGHVEVVEDDAGSVTETESEPENRVLEIGPTQHPNSTFHPLFPD